MGQDSSSPIDELIPPCTLESRTLEGLAAYIKSGKARKIIVMTGAGISTSAGIPDFRSPDTGLYANLARLNLPYAEAVFDISYFRQNPLPFYALAHELYPGKFRPTVTHSFIKLLQDKSLLLKHFTQNIDCLDREAGVISDLIVEAHGSFARQSCIECKTSYSSDLMLDHIHEKKVPRCMKADCGGLVKPEIVFFGEALPTEFFMNRQLPGQADLCLVLGTSLTVQPFASLPHLISDGVPRVLINNEIVGSLGSRADDVLILGDCDAGVRKLAKACGWLGELEELWQKTAPQDANTREESQSKSRDELISEEVDKLAKEIDETLEISNQLTSHSKSSQSLSRMQSKDQPKSSSYYTEEKYEMTGKPPDITEQDHTQLKDHVVAADNSKTAESDESQDLKGPGQANPSYNKKPLL